MALTAEGRSLTASNQRQQLAIASRAVDASKPIWQRVLSSQSVWLAAQLEILRRFHAESQSVEAAYLESYQRVEGVRPSGIERVPFPVQEMSAVMLINGPYSVKNFIGKGVSADAAIGKNFNKFSGMVRRQVLSGGRMMVDATTDGDSRAVGWRRVTDGNPCTFCAMLASRGPVYVSKDSTDGSVMRMSRSGDMKLLYHGHCGCTGEIIYGDWQPSEREQLYIDEYEKAAKQADKAGESRTQDTVLWRMRENGIFRDSPLSRNK